MNIIFICSRNNQKTAHVLDKLSKTFPKTVFMYRKSDTVPIMWTDDSCYTGLNEINKRIEELISKK